MNKTNYLKRYIEKDIEQALKTSGGVLIAGPRFCGKTTTCKKYAKSVISLNTEEEIRRIELNPSMALIGDKPRLIDEWQTVPDIWNQIKKDLDQNYIFGKYLITGSSTPVDKTKVYHSGVGRIVSINMRPLSLAESLESSNLVSLKQLFNNELKIKETESSTKLEDIAFYICRGGWPLSIKVSKDRDIALQVTKNYYNNLFIFEGYSNEKFRNKKVEVFKSILKSYARNISTQVAKSTLISDIKANAQMETFNERTFNDYLEALNDLFIVSDIESWCPNLRSKTTIRSNPVRHFVDTSIACMALNINPNDLLNDLHTFGMFFEDFVIRDLSIYSKTINGVVRHYRDSNGLECDAVIHLENGKWAAIEIKLGGAKLIQEGLATLRRFKKRMTVDKTINKPSFMMVITACDKLTITKDGIYIVPITSLCA